MPSQDMMQELLHNFRQELAERLEAVTTGLLALEQAPESEKKDRLLEELFRNIHSLKGGARAVALQPIEELAHGIEDVFGAAKRGSICLSPDLFDLLYQGIDLIGAVMAGFEAGQGVDPELDLPGYLVRLAQGWRGQPIQAPQIGTEPVPEAASRPAPAMLDSALRPWDGDTIRVPTARLDDLMAQAGELLVTRLRAVRQVEEVKKLYAYALRWQQNWQQLYGGALSFVQHAGNGGGGQARSLLENGEESLSTLVGWLRELTRHLSDDATRLAQVTEALQDGVKRTRMLPLATLLGTLRRVVRDLAREKGVEVNLEVQGADTEMDKQVLEQIQSPLVHLLRNCIDHGTELPELREQQGKPRRATITLSAERQGNTIVIQVADDGVGIDPGAVRSAAVRRGLLDAGHAAELDDEQALALVFVSGLSTAPMITEVSGRGVGLDVVRKNVEALQGRAEVVSTPGRGATFTLTLPLTLVSTRCLLLQVAGQFFAVPLSSVERMVDVRSDDINLVEGREAVLWQGHPLSLVHLADVLKLTPAEASFATPKVPAVILSAGGQRVAFLVDALLGEQDLVVKNLGKQLARVPNVAGAAVLGTGKVALVLNVSDLIKSAQQTAGPRFRPAVEKKELQGRRRTILVVDDSITTRTLEKNILTTAGYEVRLATDGEEALATLADKGCDLIVADVDMPRLDGFQLTERLKQEQRYRDIPVILVTSLDSPEYKSRGVQVGADAYIVKSSFDQDSLLETIRQLI